jgi:hypothetical protein
MRGYRSNRISISSEVMSDNGDDAKRLRKEIDRVRSTLNDLVNFDRETASYLACRVTVALEDQKKLLRALEERLWTIEGTNDVGAGGDYFSTIGENRLVDFEKFHALSSL